MGTYEPFKILHRSYLGASMDQQKFLDSVISEISNYYAEKYPSVGIDKSLVYKNVAGINYYDSNDTTTGGYFDRNTKQFNANEGISCYDEHKFHITVHELMHSTINLSKIFGTFIDEGFVDSQSNAITNDKSSYSEQRILAKILEIIFGEETLLRIALGKEIKQNFYIDPEIIKSFRIKSEIAQKLWVEQNEKYNPLYEQLLYSMSDDLLEMYKSVGNNLPFFAKQSLRIRVESEIKDFLEDEDPELESLGCKAVESFVLGLNIPKKYSGLRSENIRKLNTSLNSISSIRTNYDGNFYVSIEEWKSPESCHELENSAESSGFYIIIYEIVNYGEYTMNIEENTRIIVFDNDCQQVIGERYEKICSSIMKNLYGFESPECALSKKTVA